MRPGASRWLKWAMGLVGAGLLLSLTWGIWEIARDGANGARPASRKAAPDEQTIARLDDPATRAEEALRLGTRKAREAVPFLCRHVDDPAPEVRLACIKALG